MQTVFNVILLSLTIIFSSTAIGTASPVVSSCPAAGYTDPYSCKVILFENFDSYADGSSVPAGWWVEGGLGTWIQDGRLHANADPGNDQSLLTYVRVMFDHQLSGDLHIEFDAHVVSSVNKRNNLNSVILLSDPNGTPLRDTAMSRSQLDSTNLAALNGYQFNYVNDIHVAGIEARMRLRRQPGYEEMAMIRDYHAKIGVTYRMKIIKKGARLSFWVDGVEYIRVEDQNPWRQGVFGLITWRSNVWWDNLLIMSLNKQPMPPSNLRVITASP